MDIYIRRFVCYHCVGGKQELVCTPTAWGRTDM